MAPEVAKQKRRNKLVQEHVGVARLSSLIPLASRVRRRIARIVMSGATIAFGASGCTDEYRSFSADLAFNFDCEEGAQPRLTKAIEALLKEQGFKIGNVVQSRHERNLPPMGMKLFIDGIDHQKRMISFIAFPSIPESAVGERARLPPNRPPADTSYSVAFYTPPPTQRAEDLETTILAFVSDKLKCRVRQVSRHSNGPEKRAYYDYVFGIIEMRVNEAEGKH
jgi:hypothetical protein